MNPKTVRLLSALVGVLSSFSFSLNAQTPLFAEDFGTLTNGAAITTSNTDFTFTRLSPSPIQGSLTALQPSSIGSGASLLITSSGYSSAPNYNGVGFNGFMVGDVFTMSIDLKSASWTNGTALMIMMGDNTASVQQAYNPDGVLTTNGMTTAKIAAESLFAVRVLANGTVANLQSLSAAGTFSSFTTSETALAANTAYNLRFVANGSASEVNVASVAVPSGQMAVFLNDVWLTNAAISNSSDATAFRIFAQGNSTGNAQLTAELDNLAIYAGAVAPIPEPSTYAALAGLFALGLAIWKRQARQ